MFKVAHFDRMSLANQKYTGIALLVLFIRVMLAGKG